MTDRPTPSTADFRPPTSDVRSPSSALRSPISDTQSIVLAASLLIIWLIVIARFRAEWSLNPEYSYGWGVPVLCLYLLFERWRALGAKRQGPGGKEEGVRARGEAVSGKGTEPRATLPNALRVDTVSGKGHEVSAGEPLATLPNALGPETPTADLCRPPPKTLTPSLFALCALALAYLLTRIIHEANPVWRVPLWGLGLELVGITLTLLALAGGWSWLRNSAFPVCFFLVAIPWPTGLRNMVVDVLTRLNVATAVETLGLLNIPAMQKGNVIEIATGFVGIEDACSGIRSFQSTLMIGLFFGELYRFKIGNRLRLILAGIGLAFLFNVIRTVLLVSVASRNGLDAIHKWHDPIGVPILVGCFVGVWLVAGAVRGRAVRGKGRGQDQGPRTRDQGPQSLVPGPWSLVPPTGAPTHRRTAYIAAATAIWFILAEIGTEAWYRMHEGKFPVTAEWSVVEPASAKDLKRVPISAGLQSDFMTSGAWTDNQGRRWQMFYLRWMPTHSLGDQVKVQLALTHRPQLCLPASGMTLKSELGTNVVVVAGLSLPIETYTFEESGSPVHVFRCVQEDRVREMAPIPNLPSHTRFERLRAAWEGRRHLGARLLEIGVWGCRDVEEARQALRGLLSEIVVRAP